MLRLINCAWHRLTPSNSRNSGVANGKSSVLRIGPISLRDNDPHSFPCFRMRNIVSTPVTAARTTDNLYTYSFRSMQLSSVSRTHCDTPHRDIALFATRLPSKFNGHFRFGFRWFAFFEWDHLLATVCAYALDHKFIEIHHVVCLAFICLDITQLLLHDFS